MRTSTKKVFSHFKIVDEKIYDILTNMDLAPWIKSENELNNRSGYFQALCKQIVSQQLSGRAADTIFGRFTNLFPQKKPDPKILLKIEDQKLRDAGMSWAKASYVKNIAKEILEDNVKWDLFNLMDEKSIIAELTKIKGVGVWTAEMFLMFTLGREDVFSYGDLGLKKGIEKIYNLKKPNPKQIKTITEKWIPYRTYGSVALWKSLENEK